MSKERNTMVTSLIAGVKKHPKRTIYLASALLPMTIMLLVWFFMGVYPFGSKSLMAVDFGAQYISFYGFLKNAILTGDWSAFSYSFTKSLGGNMIGVLAYYLISPFNIFYILLPYSQYGLAVFLTIFLRYGAIGWSFAFLLVRRYNGLKKKRWLVPLMATVYALSGMLVAYQMNVIFYDAMIMLPILLVYLEEMLDGKSGLPFLLFLGLTMFLQFYMGYMISIFIALYACYYCAPALAIEGNWQDKLLNFLRPLLRALGLSLLGVALASVLLVPVVSNLLDSKGQVGGGMNFSFALQINPLDILSKLTIGGYDTTSGWSAGPNLPNIYVGSLTLTAFFLYFKTKGIHRYKKIAAIIISSIFFLSFVHEFTSKIWHMGQNPAGFFFRFSWIFSFFMVLLAYQALQKGTQLGKKGLLAGLVILVLSAVYVGSQDYSYISWKQSDVLQEALNQHLILIACLFILLLGLVSYLIWQGTSLTKQKKMLSTALAAGLAGLAFYLLYQGYLLSQIPLTVGLYLLAFYALSKWRKKLILPVLALLTVFELGLNAYLSQATFGYNDALKFQDATVSVKAVTDNVQKNADQPFYRIASTFAYSKTSPSLLSYPGLSTFSSSLERTTMDLFSYLGDVGVNAATEYANGTPLTDALYGIRYYMDIKPQSQEQVDQHPEQMNFSRFTRRLDLPRYYTETAYEDQRFIVYKNPNSFSIAYGTNPLVQNIKFGLNNAFANQNIILNSMMGAQKGTEDYKEYFQPLAFNQIETENLVLEDGEDGKAVYSRRDSSVPGIIRYRFTPRTSYTYYFYTPLGMKEARHNVSVLVNGSWLTNQKTFSQRQIWQVTDNTENQETVIEFRFTTDKIDMSQAALYRANLDDIEQVLAQRKEQNMQVEEWTNTSVKGTVTITDDSTVMMTSIPYSKDWTVKVDGKVVTSKEAWNSLLSFPISTGQHQIELTFRQPNFLLGGAMSLLALIIVLKIGSYEKKKETAT